MEDRGLMQAKGGRRNGGQCRLVQAKGGRRNGGQETSAG